MSDDEEHYQNFEQSQPQDSPSFRAPISALRRKGHVLIHGRPCRIVEINNTRTSIHLVGEDIFTGSALSGDFPSTQSVDVPHVKISEYQLVNIDDGFLNLMAQDGVPKDDVKLPGGDLGKMIQEDFEHGKYLLITVISTMGEAQAIGGREAPQGH